MIASWLKLTTDIVAGQFPLSSSVLLQQCIIQIQIQIVLNILVAGSFLPIIIDRKLIELKVTVF